ncbi:MAG: triose-phosphate isomerase [Candidatus Paceibacterota bacterium]
MNFKNKKIIIANWKMNPETSEEARKIFLSVRKKAQELSKTVVAVCPPFIFLSDFKKLYDKKISIGSQDVFWEEQGAHTGEISVSQIAKLGGSFVIVGHSERRRMGETNEMVNKKIKAVVDHGMTAVLCVGEEVRDEDGHYLQFLKDEITESLKGLGKQFLDNLIIAYEPIWAIGKNDDDAMSPSDLHETTLYIRKILIEIYGKDWVMNIPIIYGGSVSSENAEGLLFNGEAQGLLVGRDSLDTKKFCEILEIADKK